MTTILALFKSKETHHSNMKIFSTPLKSAHVVVHGFALAHAITAMSIISIYHTDPGIILSILTITMLIILARVNDYPLDVTMALTLICCLAGFFLGTIGAEIIVKIFPVSAMTAQVITTVLVTEMLGWITYIIVRRANRKE